MSKDFENVFDGIEDYEITTNYTVVENVSNDENVYAIKLLDEPYDGIIFSYGEVNFPDPEEPILAFDYEVHHVPSGMFYDDDEFKQYIGDFLVELILLGIKHNSIVYTGGVDE